MLFGVSRGYFEAETGVIRRATRKRFMRKTDNFTDWTEVIRQVDWMAGSKGRKSGFWGQICKKRQNNLRISIIFCNFAA